jgi:gamma-glutamyltranspeptidase / glutathione hydrolase
MRALIQRSFFCVFFLLFNLFSEPPSAGAERAAGGLVVSDSPLATKAGMEMLDRGGNAVDAAIATAFALAVVDQASSGIGGGGFMVIYQTKDRRAHALDFRETAPEGSRKELYMKDGKPVPSLSR